MPLIYTVDARYPFFRAIISFSLQFCLLAAAILGDCFIARLEAGEPLELRGHAAVMMAVAFSPDGRQLASGGMDGSVRLWSPRGEAIRVLDPDDEYVMSVAFSPDGKLLATASSDGSIRLSELSRNQPIRSYKVESETRLIFSRNGVR